MSEENQEMEEKQDQMSQEAQMAEVTAENLKPYLTKGKQIAIDGYLKQDRWEKDGQKMSKVTIVANNVQLLGGKGDGPGQSVPGAPKFQPNNAPAGGGYSSESYGDTGSDFPEDIPF